MSRRVSVVAATIVTLSLYYLIRGEPLLVQGEVDATRLDLSEELHGHLVSDPYRWLEDATSEQTEAWSAAQDALLAETIEDVPGHERLSERVTTLLGAGVVSAPSWRGDRQFFMRRTALQEHTVLLTRNSEAF